MFRFMKLLYSTLCGAIVSVFLWSLLWFAILRPILRLEDGFFIFSTLAFILMITGGYYGHNLIYSKPNSNKTASRKKVMSIINFSLGSLIVILFVYLIWGLFPHNDLEVSDCKNTQNVKIMSSSEFYATYLTRNCGATTYYSEHILVDNTEVFSAQIRTDTRPPLKIEWIDDTLFVSLVSDSITDIRVLKKKESAYTPLNGSVTVKYSEAINNAKRYRD